MSRLILAIFLFALCLSCTKQTAIQSGDEVNLYFRIFNQSGERVDDSFQPNGNLPLHVVVGKHYLVTGIEQKLIGLKIGEKTSFNTDSEMAYGSDGVYYIDKQLDTIFLIKPNENLKIEIEILSIKTP